MTKLAEQEALLFNIMDFFTLMAKRLKVLDQHGDPYPRGFGRGDKKLLFEAWNGSGPFARKVVEDALTSTLNRQRQKGETYPLAYHLEAIVRLQGEQGHKYQLERADRKGKGAARKLLDKALGRGGEAR